MNVISTNYIKPYLFEAINNDINKKTNDGTNFKRGFLTFKCDNWAQNIKKAIDKEA